MQNRKTNSQETAPTGGVVSQDFLLKILDATPLQKQAIEQILAGKATESPVATSGPLLLGMGAGARFLGVSRPTLWRMIKAGVVARVEILPGSFRVSRAELEGLLAKAKN